jgi:hypothetical protein
MGTISVIVLMTMKLQVEGSKVSFILSCTRDSLNAKNDRKVGTYVRYFVSY